MAFTRPIQSEHVSRAEQPNFSAHLTAPLIGVLDPLRSQWQLPMQSPPTHMKPGLPQIVMFYLSHMILDFQEMIISLLNY